MTTVKAAFGGWVEHKRGMKTAASFQQKNIRVAGIVGMLAALADISLQYGPTG